MIISNRFIFIYRYTVYEVINDIVFLIMPCKRYDGSAGQTSKFVTFDERLFYILVSGDYIYSSS